MNDVVEACEALLASCRAAYKEGADTVTLPTERTGRLLRLLRDAAADVGQADPALVKMLEQQVEKLVKQFNGKVI